MTKARQVIAHTALDEERALYGLRCARLEDVTFSGPADGESALKECDDLQLIDCRFDLRYPLWHVNGFTMEHATLTETCRAALWYARQGLIRDSRLFGIKAVRECDDVRIEDCEIVSPEFGWKCRGLDVRITSIEAEYAFLDSRDVTLDHVELRGKYTFQYVHDLVITNSVLDTKDAFWHARNVTVRDSLVRGEYLGWYSEGLTLERCRIEGTQPLVQCRGLKVIDCTMEGCDLAFEGSEVEARVLGSVTSIRDPRSGRIEVESVGELVHDTRAGCGAQIVIGNV